MFNAINLQAITPLLDRASQRDRYALLRPETPLEAVVRPCIPGTVSAVENQSILDLLKQCDTGEVLHNDVHGHESALAEYVDVVGRTIDFQFTYVRETVVPAVGRIFNLIKDSLATEQPLVWEVVPVDLSPLAKNSNLMVVLQRWSELNARGVKLPYGFPERSEAELTELVRTGSASLDAALADTLALYPAGWLTTVYETYFKRSPGGQPWAGSARPDSLDAVIVAHLLAHSLLELPPADLQLSLSEFKKLLAEFKEQSAVCVINTLNVWQRYVRQNRLVLSWPIHQYVNTGKEQIRVHSDVYNRFLADGGSVEVVIGSHVSDQKSDTGTLLQNRDTYLTAYRRYVAQAERTFSEGVAERTRTLLGKHLSMEAVNLPEDQRLPIPVDALQIRIQQCIASVPDVELVKRPYAAVRAAVCRSLFPHVEAERMLAAMDEILELDPGLNPAQAGYQVALTWIVRHLLSQVTWHTL